MKVINLGIKKHCLIVKERKIISCYMLSKEVKVIFFLTIRISLIKPKKVEVRGNKRIAFNVIILLLLSTFC